MEQQTPEALIRKQAITNTLEDNYMPYAMSVIVSRAIPEIDGFKPSHRKILYTMYKMGLLTGSRTKSANVVGQTMKLNPHGDQAIYETLVRMSRGNAALLHPYIDSKGNFGRQYSRDMRFAAARYTEVKLDAICQEIFGSLEKNSVDFMDNYDGTMKEPMLLPATFPSILVNSNQGIAVGMASNICSFNLKEVCEATIALIQDPDCDLLKHLPGPDFSTGGEIIHDPSAIRQIYETGRGSIKLRARYAIDRKNQSIDITAIPYTTTVEAIIDEITQLVRQGKAREINDIRDETDLKGLHISIEYKRTADPDALVQKLLRYTGLQSSFSCNFNVLIQGSPRLLGIKSLLSEWLAWRRSCVRREIAYELDRKKDRLHLLQGLEKILLDIDRAIRIIRETEKESKVIDNLMQGFGIDAVQAEFIAEIRLRQLNRQYILQKTADLKTIQEEIEGLEQVLGDGEKINQRIIHDLRHVKKKYGRERQSTLVHVEEVQHVPLTKIIDDYRLKLFLTDHGYLKKLALTSLRSAGELKTKDDDRIILSQEGMNTSDVLCFSDKGIVYKLKCHEIPDHKPSDLGEYTTNLLSLAGDERIIFVRMTDADYQGQLLLAFANGKVARIPLATYQTKTNRKLLKNAYSTLAPIVSIHYLSPEEDEEFFMASNIGKALVFDSKLIPLKQTRSSQGVRVMQMKKGSRVDTFEKFSDCDLLDSKGFKKIKLPAVGRYLKDEHLKSRQLSLEDA